MKKIIIMRRGLIGDTIVAIPAMKYLRRAYPEAHIALISEIHKKNGVFWAKEILADTGLVDEFIAFDGYNLPFGLRKLYVLLSLLLKAYSKGPWDLGIALDAPDEVTHELHLFLLLGVKRKLGPNPAPVLPPDLNGSLLEIEHRANVLINILSPLNISLDVPLNENMRIPIGEQDRKSVDEWIYRHNIKRHAPWIAFGPWSNMPSKEYPMIRFINIVKRLREFTGATMFFFGGSENMADSEMLTRECEGTYSTTGQFNVRQSIYFLSLCNLFIGVDTGTMHMAVSAGVPCVAIFSARDSRGLWNPYGEGHIVLRERVPCEGCMRTECSIEGHPCIQNISQENILAAAVSILGRANTRG